MVLTALYKRGYIDDMRLDNIFHNFCSDNSKKISNGNMDILYSFVSDNKEQLKLATSTAFQTKYLAKLWKLPVYDSWPHKENWKVRAFDKAN